jgi:Flp pilus assembly protein CpaB
MKSRGGRFLLVLGALLAAMAFVVVYVVMSKTTSDIEAATVPTPAPMKAVVVATGDLPAYTMLSASNVVLQEVEATTVTSNTVTDPSAVYGKMTLVPLTKGQQLQQNYVTQSGFSTVLAKGEKAFALAVTERNTFGGAVTENDRVDVLWTTTFRTWVAKPGPQGQVEYVESVFTSTKTLLQDIHVLRVIDLRPPVPTEGQESQAQPASTTNGSPTQSNAPSPEMYAEDAPYQAVLILGVTDQQAEVLKFARENGILDLTLRSSATFKAADGQEMKGDREAEKTTGITIDKLITDYGLPTPKIVEIGR